MIPDVTADPRFLWVRGIDQQRFIASMLSVPLVWNDQIVGVLNVQTEQHARLQPVRRRPARGDRRPARRDRREGPPADRGRGARRAAPARSTRPASELIALVTHELRTPLAVVRAYTELLAEDPPLDGRESRDPDAARPQRQAWHDAAMEQVERLDRLVDSILASVRIVPPEAGRPSRPTDVEAAIDEVVDSIGPIVRQHRLEVRPRAPATSPWPTRRGSARSSST